LVQQPLSDLLELPSFFLTSRRLFDRVAISLFVLVLD